MYFYKPCCRTSARRCLPGRRTTPARKTVGRKLTTGRAQVKHLGNAVPGSLPWTFISGLDPNARAMNRCTTQEPFCSVISDTRVGSADPVEFLERAVDFCNNRLWGTLNANLIVHPQSLAGSAHQRCSGAGHCKAALRRDRRQRLHRACPSYSPHRPWGAYPGSTPEDIQSGSGFVHNTSMLEGVEKTVLRAPLTTFPKPAYLRQSPHLSQDGAKNCGDGGERQLGEGAGDRLRCDARLVMRELRLCLPVQAAQAGRTDRVPPIQVLQAAPNLASGGASHFPAR
jgi:hypothetical protein